MCVCIYIKILFYINIYIKVYIYIPVYRKSYKHEFPSPFVIELALGFGSDSALMELASFCVNSPPTSPISNNTGFYLLFNLPVNEILRFWLLDSEGMNNTIKPFTTSSKFSGILCEMAASLIIRGKHS